MRKAFQARTGAFRSDDAWFEARSRAFWDDALTTQGLARLAEDRLDEASRAFVEPFSRAHRGLFSAHDVDARGALLVDEWSGAELRVHHLDEAQAIALRHAHGYVDARVVGIESAAQLFALPGLFHHAEEAREPMNRVLDVARQRGMTTTETLDTLMRMELVHRASTRVKASVAYRAETVGAASPGAERGPLPAER